MNSLKLRSLFYARFPQKKGASRYHVHIGGGGGRSWKIGSCVILIYKSISNPDKGGGGVKIRTFCGCHQWMLPNFMIRFGPYRVAADMEGNGEFQFLEIYSSYIKKIY